MTPGQRSVSSTPAARLVLIGTVTGGLLGAAVGLVLGLITYPPTAWAAVIELGVPGLVTGAAVGLVAASVAAVLRRSRGHRGDG